MLSIKGPGSSILYVRKLYRLPRRDPVADAFLLEVLEKIATWSDILIMGNFNAPQIDWSLAYAHSSDLAFDGCLLSTTLNPLLIQHITFQTRVREGQKVNFLDLVLMKSQDGIDENTRNKDSIPLLRPAEGIDLTEDGAKAGHLSEFFRSVFTKETRYDYRTDVVKVDTINETVQFIEAIVLKKLLGLKDSKSPGPDEVPARQRVGKTTLQTFFTTGGLPAN
ncbi:unnamed protein product [Schistocephalus solidus]|uniref:Endo/exonuclease/phosphatase domain-containing protein n=1 Tax=Schistocephalus solidus TaxID=70667 RepID=A0A183SRW1_SCHSO|nr:unnamed protein product [Schistocephalus solidus]